MKTELLNESRLYQDIRNQENSLSRVLVYQLGEQAAVLQEAAALVRNARKVVITGMGASLYASLPLQYQFAELGIDSVIVESAELLHYQQRICANALVIFVSRSGESVELVKLLPQVKKLAQRTIALTNEPQSTLAVGSDLTLIVGSLPDERMAIQSYTGTLLAIILFGSAVAGDLDPVREQLQNILASIPTLLNRCSEDRLRWDSFLVPRTPVHLLGRGPSCASAMEGSLLFNETAKEPAIGMAAASFRHGSVEIVDSTFRGLIFAPLGKTRELNLALAQSLERFGGKTLVIGPAQMDSAQTERNAIHFLELPATPERFAPLLEIIPIQFAALRMAERKGLPVGELRHIAQVTTDEMNF